MFRAWTCTASSELAEIVAARGVLQAWSPPRARWRWRSTMQSATAWPASASGCARTSRTSCAPARRRPGTSSCWTRPSWRRAARRAAPPGDRPQPAALSKACVIHIYDILSRMLRGAAPCCGRWCCNLPVAASLRPESAPPNCAAASPEPLAELRIAAWRLAQAAASDVAGKDSIEHRSGGCASWHACRGAGAGARGAKVPAAQRARAAAGRAGRPADDMLLLRRRDAGRPAAGSGAGALRPRSSAASLTPPRRPAASSGAASQGGLLLGLVQALCGPGALLSCTPHARLSLLLAGRAVSYAARKDS